MADAKLSALTALAGTALAAADLLYVVDTSVATSKSIRGDLLLNGLLLVGSGPLTASATGGLVQTEPATTGTPSPSVTVTRPAHTALTASTEYSDIVLTAATQQFATGALATQRSVVLNATTYTAVGATVITTAATLAVNKPIASTNVTITRPFAIDAEDSRVKGTLTVLAPSGTAGTNQIEISHDATNSLVNFKGTTYAQFANDSFNFFTFGTTSLISLIVAAGTITLRSDKQIGWSSTTNVLTGNDTGLARAAAKVVSVTDGSSGTGWIQNSAGDSRSSQASPVTNATDTMANITGLTSTLIAGRKYGGELTLYLSTDQAAEGAKIDFDGGAGTITNFAAALTANEQTAVAGVTVSAALATDLTLTALNGTGVNCVKYSLAFTCNAAGTFIPRFSQNAHATGTLTVVASTLRLWDIA